MISRAKKYNHCCFFMCPKKATRVLFVFILLTAAADSITLVTSSGSIHLDSEPRKDNLSGVFNITQGTPAVVGFNSVARDGFSQLEITNRTVNDSVILSYIFGINFPIGYLQIGEFIFVENAVSGESYYLSKGAIPTELDNLRDQQAYLQSKQQQQQQSIINKLVVLRDLKTKYDMTRLELLSRTLGEELGLAGMDYPSAMSIHLAAKLLTPIATAARGKKNVTEELHSEDCPNERSQKCVRKPIGADCLGLCGKGVHCWSWVCGDCCFHQGCYEHDVCCKEHGFISWGCLSVWKFSCKRYSCC